jgi:hypothetical protein
MSLDEFLMVFGPGLLYLLLRMVHATWVDWRLGDDGQPRYTPDDIPSWYVP